MPIETVIRIGLRDVQRLSFECRECHSVTGLPRDRWDLPHACRDNHLWGLPDEFRVALRDAPLGALRYFAEHEAELPFVLRLEARMSSAGREVAGEE